MSWRAIAGFRLVTANLERSTAFYAALGFAVGAARPISDDEMVMLGLAGAGWRVPMRLGETPLDLDYYERAGKPYPKDANAAASCFQHLALVTSDASRSWSRAVAAGAKSISSEGPVTLPASAGSVTAVKFRDPDGHPLELLHFPDAKGEWRGEGMLGIDHSAITVAEIARSHAFYAGHGLMSGDATLNHGPTQARLDGLDSATVDVIPMRPATSPHIEILHYRHPQRRNCGLVAVNDIAATRVVWRDGPPMLIRDPDGHLHQIGG